MIERLLAADAALERGELDHAQRVYAQVADADPRNAIALVGLARVALARGDRPAALELVDRALVIDPDEAAARRLLAEVAPPGEVAAPGEVTAPVAPAEPKAPAAPARRPGGLIGWLRRLLRLG